MVEVLKSEGSNRQTLESKSRRIDIIPRWDDNHNVKRYDVVVKINGDNPVEFEVESCRLHDSWELKVWSGINHSYLNLDLIDEVEMLTIGDLRLRIAKGEHNLHITVMLRETEEGEFITLSGVDVYTLQGEVVVTMYY